MLAIERLITFIDLVDERSFASVAKKRGVTKAAISKQLAQLEHECGIQLLYRTPKAILTTEFGEEIYTKSKVLKKLLNEIESTLYEFRTEPQGNLRILSSIDFGQQFLLPHLPKWIEKYPDIQLDFQIDDRLLDDNQTYDVICGSPSPSSSQDIRVMLGKERYYLCGSPAYLQNHGHPKTTKDLNFHKFISHTYCSNHFLIETPEEKISIKPSFCLNNYQGIINLATQGMGLIWGSHSNVHRALKSGNLVEVLPQIFQNCYHPLYLYYRGTNQLQPKVRAFIDFAKECTKNFPEFHDFNL